MILSVQPYISLMRLNRPIGIFLLLWPTLIALWLASNGNPDLKTTLIFAAGVVIMRSAGCVINDFADRNIDAYVVRTKNRPLAIKQLTAKNALVLFFTLILLAASLVLQLNMYTILLSGVALLLAIIYPFTKRFTNYPQFVLGMAFAWAIPMVYAQLQGHLSVETWLLFAATQAWVVAYDTQYAMADKADDLRLGIKSTAIAFGKYDKAIIFVWQLLTVLLFAWIGKTRGFGCVFYVGLIVCFGLILYQQWLITDREPQKCFRAFLNNNYFGAALFFSVLCH